jgi:pimeloyl-ACP methyl ester carboxylesterase
MNRTGKTGRAVAVIAAVASAGAGRAVAQQPPADTVPPASVVESPYTFRSGAITLEGTLARPRAGGRVPVALIVAGSGPTDRNGNAGGLRTNAYAQLAWRLAERGVASLRYDKRVLPSARGGFDPSALTFDDLAADLTAGARSLQGDPRFAEVVVIGHSEGGALAIRAVKNGLEVSGLALISTAGRTMTAILHEQLGRQVDPATLARFDSAMTRYLAGEDPGEVPAPLMPLFLPVNRRYTQTVAEFDPVAELGVTTLPVLILQGAADLQVTVADAQALQRARSDALLTILPAANHVLKAVTDTTIAAQLPAYQDPTIPIVPRLIDELVSWISVLR